MPIAKVNQIELYYEIHGRGPPLLCIAGYSRSSLAWQDLIDPLSSRYQLILFDNRGSGRSSSPETPYSIELLAQDTAELLDTLKISKCFAIGHSMGGPILLQLCISYPQMIQKGILVSSFATVPNKRKRFAKWIKKLIDQGMEKKLLVEGIILWVYSEEFLSNEKKTQMAIDNILNDPYPQPKSGLLGQMQALLDVDLRPHLNQIKTPLLIASGDEDIGFPLFCAEELMEHIPHAELYIFHKQAHMIVEERKEELLKLIHTFL